MGDQGDRVRPPESKELQAKISVPEGLGRDGYGGVVKLAKL